MTAIDWLGLWAALQVIGTVVGAIFLVGWLVDICVHVWRTR